GVAGVGFRLQGSDGKGELACWHDVNYWRGGAKVFGFLVIGSQRLGWLSSRWELHTLQRIHKIVATDAALTENILGCADIQGAMHRHRDTPTPLGHPNMRAALSG